MDVYFNIVLLFFLFVGVYVYIWWFDFVGVLFLVLYVIVDWVEMCMGNISRLMGSNVGDVL